jgi:hypothetical protein
MRFKEPKRPKLDVAGAEAMAAEALAFIAADAPKLNHFLAETGIDVDDLRSGAGSTGVLVAVLDYVNANEALLLTFAAAHGLSPDAIDRALLLLQGRPGGG